MKKYNKHGIIALIPFMVFCLCLLYENGLELAIKIVLAAILILSTAFGAFLLLFGRFFEQ